MNAFSVATSQRLTTANDTHMSYEYTTNRNYNEINQLQTYARQVLICLVC